MQIASSKFVYFAISFAAISCYNRNNKLVFCGQIHSFKGEFILLDFKSAELQGLLDDFYTLTGMKPCIFDTELNEVAFSPVKLFNFCAYLRSNPDLDRACRSCDMAAMQKCRRTRQGFVYRCHIGLKEYVAPICYDEVVVGFVLIGQVSDGSQEEYRAIQEHLQRYNIDLDHCREIYDRLPHHSAEKLAAACNIMDACSSYIYHKRMLEVRYLNMAQQVEKYIMDNIAWDLSIEHLCEHFNISRAELYQIFHNSFNASVADFIRGKRIAMAEQMIRTTDHQISEIASNVGFYDYNYFSKIFRKSYGVSPRNYRKTLAAAEDAAAPK